MGSTLSLADRPKGMIRSGSFRDPVDDGENPAPSYKEESLLLSSKGVEEKEDSCNQFS